MAYHLTRLPNDTCRVILTTRYRFSNLVSPFLDITLGELESNESAELMIRYQLERTVPITLKQLQTLFQKTQGHPLVMRLSLAQLSDGRAFEDIILEFGHLDKTKLFEYAFEKAVEYAGKDGMRLFAILSLFEPYATHEWNVYTHGSLFI